MTDVVSKERLLAGGRPEPFAVPALDGAVVLLRPLSASEGAEVHRLQVSGITSQASGDPGGPRPVGKAAPRGARSAPQMSLHFGEIVEGSDRAELLATKYGLAEPELSEQEIDDLRPAEIVSQIGREVMRRSGLGSNQREQLREFRDLAGRAGDPDAPPLGEPAVPDAGNADVPPEGVPPGGDRVPALAEAGRA